jgi:hypothetical protein
MVCQKQNHVLVFGQHVARDGKPTCFDIFDSAVHLIETA